MATDRCGYRQVWLQAGVATDRCSSAVGALSDAGLAEDKKSNPGCSLVKNSCSSRCLH